MPRPRGSRRRRFSRRPGRRPVPRLIAVIGAAVALETLLLWLRSHRLGGDVVVRCRQGHLFTTIWIPAVSVKALRLGWWRVQRCPVGQHWTIVTPVKEAELSHDERRLAGEHQDIRIP
jgi:hypothetical protein